jgi:hypothetical protein
VGHEDSAFEIGFGQDIRESGCMVEMETGVALVSSALEGQHITRGNKTKAEARGEEKRCAAYKTTGSLDGGEFEGHCIVVDLAWYTIR